jgi:hypothetical protein
MEEEERTIRQTHQSFMKTQRHVMRHGKTKIQGIGTITLKRGIMLRTKNPLDKGSRLKVNQRTNQRTVVSAGR